MSGSPLAGRVAALCLALVAASGLAACGGSDHHGGDHAGHGRAAPPMPPPPSSKESANGTDVYEHDRPGMLSPAVKDMPARVYVPDTKSDDVIVLDQNTFKQVDRFKVGRLPQHVVPSWDLTTLWVNDNDSNDLVPIDPRTGKHGKPVHVDDPYNLYFTPDGKYAVVMAERNERIDFRDAHTMKLVKSVKVPCRGPNHADFSASGDFFLTACEFSGDVLRIDTAGQRLTGMLSLTHHAMPQDVKLSPDGRTFYVADMATNGVWAIDARSFRKTGFIPTGKGAHGLYVSRDSKVLYVSNRGEGSVSLVAFGSGRVERTWRLPGGGSPDMGGVSADGRVLWLSGRYDGVVYAISTVDGRMIRKIRVGAGPHGLCVYPQPGRYSLGHTGVLR
ncbi:YncE family protein [Actinomadura rupiterrae]|uniref:YncE family protein n=1 Tax=Actinomadura rupiterrae TaxID=559627 RepID=UPI0020A3B0C5|nr:beta-propeller fold lactonase family protein [Actinomadura rupiterrae]MCP2340776.1 sugar lactone lactonase YvrE [Actinomadura rupiterrae]